MRREVAPLVLRSISKESLIPREARETLANAITWLDPGSKDGLVSKRQAADALSSALVQERKLLPALLSNEDFKASQDAQIHLVKLLSVTQARKKFLCY